jgi:hypothetical protein
MVHQWRRLEAVPMRVSRHGTVNRFFVNADVARADGSGRETLMVEMKGE